MDSKYKVAAEIISKNFACPPSVVDIGCRDKILKKHIVCNSYLGVDVDPSTHPDVLVDISIEKYFHEGQFDLLVALDVLEHTENPFEFLIESARISSIQLIYVPNMYNRIFRYRFITGKPLSDKYSLSKKHSYSGGYRHRWIYTQYEMDKFIDEFGVEFKKEIKSFRFRERLGLLGSLMKCCGLNELNVMGTFYLIKNK